MRDSVPSVSYSSVCNVLRQWNIPLIPTYRVYRLYDIFNFRIAILSESCIITYHAESIYRTLGKRVSPLGKRVSPLPMEPEGRVGINLIAEMRMP